MKKALSLFALFLGLAVVSTPAYATIPVIDGVASPGEWDGIPSAGAYSTFVAAFSPDDPAIPNAYDFASAVVIQDLDAFGGDPALADGVYILLTVHGANPSLEALGGNPGDTPDLALSIDFFGDGSVDLLLTHDVGPFKTDGTGQHVDITFFPGGPTTVDLLAAGGAFTIVDGNKTATGCGAAFDPACTLGGGPITAIEYFIPTGTAGTPSVPLPVGIYQALYDNGGPASDDFIISTTIPEPSTFLMLGAGLLGLAGFGAKFRK